MRLFTPPLVIGADEGFTADNDPFQLKDLGA